MNIRLLYEIQTVIFRIIFILFGAYIILVLLKEIFLLFWPSNTVTITKQPEITNKTEPILYSPNIQPLIKPVEKEKEYIVYTQPPPIKYSSPSPSPVKKTIVKKRKSRRSKK